jgi:hypothetical protein
LEHGEAEGAAAVVEIVSAPDNINDQIEGWGRRFQFRILLGAGQIGIPELIHHLFCSIEGLLVGRLNPLRNGRIVGNAIKFQIEIRGSHRILLIKYMGTVKNMAGDTIRNE